MLKINNLTRRFGKYKAIDEIDLEVQEPGLYVFVGANGSGKSTLFNLIAGLILSDKGNISLTSVPDPENGRSETGMSTEPFFTEPSLTVKEIFEIGLRIKRAFWTDNEKWLSYWELNDVYDKPFRALSTGMKKRLGIALSLIGNPVFLIWDEPYNGLDPLGIELLNQLISELVLQGKYILLSTHLLNEIKFQQAIFFILKEGKLVGKVSAGQSVSDGREQILNLLK